MSWAITGTPGVGKSTIASRLAIDAPVVHLNDVVDAEGIDRGRDPVRGSKVVDLDALAAWFAVQPADVVVESHLAHVLPVDRVVVLRCHPDELRTRLHNRAAEHDDPDAMIDENAEAERLDLVLAEAVERHGRDKVYEIDTTDRPVDAVVTAVTQTLHGEREPQVGSVSFLEGNDAR